MPASQTWNEWHLTPRGWEPGHVSRTGTDAAEFPPDRVLTCHYLESAPDFAGSPCLSLKTTWHCNDAALVRELMLRYGHCPPLGTSAASVSKQSASRR